MRDVITASGKLLGTAWRMSRAKFVAAVVLMVSGAAAGPAIAAALAWMTDAALHHHRTSAGVAGVVVAALAVAALKFSHFAHIAYFELSELAELDFDEQLIGLSNGSAGTGHHEVSEHADTLTLLQSDARQFTTSLESLLSAIGLVLAMVLTGVLLATVNPVLLLLPLAAIPALFTGQWAERYVDRTRTATAEKTRVAMNLFRLTTTARFAGEVRVSGLQEEMRTRHAALWSDVSGRLWRADLVASCVRLAGQLVFAAAYVGAVLVMVRSAASGHRSVGDVVLVITLAAQVNQQVVSAVTLHAALLRTAAAYRRLDLLRAAVADEGPSGADRIPERLREGIVVDGVSFSYAGSDKAVFEEARFTLPAGSTVAIVGENGAGKSTLVKLLCGFYTPSRGRILVDGVDLREMSPESWRERIAAGFQDFVHFEFAARQTVGLGDLPRSGSDQAVLDALGRAQATDVLQRFPDGLDTQLGKSYTEGAELSGGQWQKLALGRAMMRTDPLLLVLDEPASALDAEAEHALFENYAVQAKRVAAETGAITVLISHRFSTVRMADLIVVVQDGVAAEVGDHDTLLAGGGLYAELFTLQAEAYR